MKRRFGALAATGLGVVAGALAAPDGPDWTVADDPEGCGSCHLSDSAPIANAGNLQIQGLPQRFEAGRQYLLTVVLEDPALKNAGFLLTVRTTGDAAGNLISQDDRVESGGDQARSTYAGSFPEEPGRAHWELLWAAPEVVDASLSFDLWANAGNDDLSPLGDHLYHTSITVDARDRTR